VVYCSCFQLMKLNVLICEFVSKDYEKIDTGMTVVEELLPHIFQVLKSWLHEISYLARTLESCVRIPFKAWMFVCVYSVCVDSELATG
jgi:hypothetical protein